MDNCKVININQNKYYECSEYKTNKKTINSQNKEIVVKPEFKLDIKSASYLDKDQADAINARAVADATRNLEQRSSLKSGTISGNNISPGIV